MLTLLLQILPLISHTTNTASKIIGLSTPSPSHLNGRDITCIAQMIVHDPGLTLNPFFKLLPHGHRYKTLEWERAMYCSRNLAPPATRSTKHTISVNKPVLCLYVSIDSTIDSIYVSACSFCMDVS